MQVTQPEINNKRRVGVEEEFIKFRPSPNFKNMKKFLKSRSDYNETTTLAARQMTPEPEPSKREEPTDIKPVIVQPPLPPYPPPPYSPELNITIKKEKEEDDNDSTIEESIEAIHESLIQQEMEQREQKNDGRPKKTICKEFIRGNCKRTICKYAHEVDVTQLAGVYTFCWNYQNSVCTFPNCRFVHATVFEEAEFYRTGQLPPHARAHMKKMPPPPPPEEMQTQSALTTSFANPPPALHPSVDKPVPVISCVPATNIEQRPAEPAVILSPRKREWSAVEDFTTSPCEIQHNEHLAKKCKNCDLMEFRLQYHREKVENMLDSTEELEKKVAQMVKKNEKLTKVVNILMNPTDPKNGFLSASDKNIIEQIYNFIDSNRYKIEGSGKNLINNPTLTSLMAQLMCSGDQTLSPETS